VLILDQKRNKKTLTPALISSPLVSSSNALQTTPSLGDEMFADSYPMREVEDGFFFEVDGSVS